MRTYNYTFWLLRSLRLACLSIKKNIIPVGCIANFDSIELASSHNMIDVHAEVVASTKASYILNTRNLVNILLFITLEPCFVCVTHLMILCLKIIFFGIYTSINKKGFYLKCRFVSFNFFSTLLTCKIHKLLLLFFVKRR